MIDIHSHILPDFDDGARSVDEAVEMACQAVDAGVTVLYVTPHIDASADPLRSNEIATQAEALQRELDDRSIQLRLIPGAEVYPSPGVPRAIEAGLPVTLGGSRYVLLDTPLSALPPRLDHLIFDLQSLGITPILAHPERSAPVQSNPGVLEPLLDRGVLIQINASSIAAQAREPVHATASTILRHNWAHFVASDTHSPRRRRTMLAEAKAALVDLIGSDAAYELTHANGERVIAGAAVPSDPSPYTRPKRGILALFARRELVTR
jgi:protein-tyrosine phosphatase